MLSKALPLPYVLLPQNTWTLKEGTLLEDFKPALTSGVTRHIRGRGGATCPHSHRHSPRLESQCRHEQKDHDFGAAFLGAGVRGG